MLIQIFILQKLCWIYRIPDRRLVLCNLQLAINCWLLEIGYWVFNIGYFLNFSSGVLWATYRPARTTNVVQSGGDRGVSGFLQKFHSSGVFVFHCKLYMPGYVSFS